MAPGSAPPRSDPRCFVAVRSRDRTWVVDLPKGQPCVIGSRPDAAVRLDGTDASPKHATLRWSGEGLELRDEGTDAGTFVNGKRITGVTELGPGDEVSIGRAQAVIGITAPVTASRRAFTHHEFRERLHEELARAARGGRPTALIMIQARPGEGMKIAATALDAFRAGDTVGTYAHDELELLLPDTPGDTARLVIERLLAEAGATGSSTGIAVAPGDADNPERLMRAARAALARSRASGNIERPAPKQPVAAQPALRDAVSRALADELGRLALENVPVLLLGESSAGKGVFARIVHEKSARSSGPFVIVSCAALVGDRSLARALGPPESSDGAAAAGARGGTLLLDEVGELSADGQARLLGFLDREGDAIRVVATTQRDLGGMVERGAFLRALHERLAVRAVRVPALRDRQDDIIPLAEAFALEAGAPPPVRMSPGALARLRSYPWPGNVLELRNAMERAVRLAKDGEILAEHLPLDTLPVMSGDGRLREHVDSMERDAIIKALAEHNHNQTHAARRLGISRRALIYKMEKYGLKPPPGTLRRA